MPDYDRRAVLNGFLRNLSAEVSDVLGYLERLERGCTEGLTAYGMCERRLAHQGRHWREDCGAWWFAHDRGLKMERPEHLAYVLGETNDKP